MIVKNYWYIAGSALPQDYAPFADDALLVEPAALLDRLTPSSATVLGHWNAQEQVGHVSALGLCLGRHAHGVRIFWREVDITLKPNPAGRTHWIHKPFFKFADAVVARYGLADLFAERFPDMDAFTFSAPASSSGISRRLPTSVTPGYVYLIRSPYGFKIGKTVNMKDRVRLFGVKLPFKISVEHCAHFDDYTQAERSLHRHFAAECLEGEWFNLSPTDIAYIKTLGRPVPPDEIRRL
ncbi:MAG: GIY-YIG nuclease family protein [Burkholderiales bacterium]|nr:GIY-YIG nuclease family protein [Burkholderiales bacterium]